MSRLPGSRRREGGRGGGLRGGGPEGGRGGREGGVGYEIIASMILLSLSLTFFRYLFLFVCFLSFPSLSPSLPPSLPSSLLYLGIENVTNRDRQPRRGFAAASLAAAATAGRQRGRHLERMGKKGDRISVIK